MSVSRVVNSASLVVDELCCRSRFAPQVVAHRIIKARKARFAPWPEHLDASIVRMLEDSGVEALYTHQARATQLAMEGNNVAVVTPTASGKSLCYNLPVYQELLRDRDATALFLFPTKALAHDQLDTLGRELEALDLAGQAGAFDGDTPAARRAPVRRHCRAIVTNPDMLHASVLPSHPRWKRFFEGLRYVIIDEMHQYRGVFGSHVANVIRRLKRLSAFYGSAPQFLLASATIANPQDLARSLVGQSVKVVSENGAPSGEKHVFFYNPAMVDSTLGIRRPAIDEAADIAESALAAGAQSMIFARSRLHTELLLRRLRECSETEQLAAQSIQGYRGGYLPEERRAIEAGLREGRIRAVVGTNALELGVDIGGLDVVVMAGYPGSIASTWQQAGRAGRGQHASVAVLVASSHPLDQYIIKHPEYVTDSSPERALVDPDNVYLLLDHLKCALFELPMEREEFQRESSIHRVLEYLEEEGVAERRKAKWFWTGKGYPSSEVSLRSSQPDIVTVIARDAQQQAHSIGQCDWSSVPRLLHEGAIYMHAGQQYLVEKLDWDRGLAETRPVEVDFYTHASETTMLAVDTVKVEGDYSGMTLSYGEVSVTSQVTGYRRIGLDTNQTLGWGEVDLPEQTMLTTATWLELLPPMLSMLVEEGGFIVSPPASRGPNWLQQRDAALQRDGYRCVGCGAVESAGRRHHVHHLVPFREFHWHPGKNRNYIKANELDNLVTLCPDCHQEAERAVMTRTAFAGLGHVLGNLVPLFAMCDRHDVGIHTVNTGSGETIPRLYIYDRVPAGVGLAERALQVFGELMRAAEELVSTCACNAGCPSCIGPLAMAGDRTKRGVVSLARMLAQSYESGE